ncbi:Nramp family divalent metal transporter [Roseimaritima ulvae]|uniref:Manganese transport protein MntH n=1 Tax=Roseimaritima ulvae TaxID=980254 RepID=A0A5B9R760_9BACT|nr:Nramp family divalent metal transporter [Roseimaritima ulvae]QEG42283.1 manganese transport protein MntH [Roseimaritima ulvae]
MSESDEQQAIEPPQSLPGIIRYAGPGLIVAGSIVGSGELIATTKTGAQAGYSLLWLILIGCMVKVFTQIEFGRYTLISGKTTLEALSEVPGPRIRGRGNWLVWYWVIMWFASISQLGGIVGGVGQALAISVPITQMGRDYNAVEDASERELILARAQASGMLDAASPPPEATAGPTAAELRQDYDTRYSVEQNGERKSLAPADAAMWAAIVAAMTSVLLVVGRYRLIQSLSTALVGIFTALTIGNLFLLQRQEAWRVTANDVLGGLTPGLPEGSATTAVATALATFGIIGVGAGELVAYPYWCLEKGYAKFTGKFENTAAWLSRAQGWLRVMQYDSWGAMVIYTFATIAFYLLGAAILHPLDLDPQGTGMVRTLAVMYVPVFAAWAAPIFLFGAFAVLYSTFFVANAGHARVFADAMRVVGLIDHDDETRQRWVTRLSGFFPVLCLVIYLMVGEPAKLVLLSGVAQGVMLPMLAAAALYFRYHRCVDGLTPGTWWDAFLWISAGLMVVTGGWTIYAKLISYFGT